MMNSQSQCVHDDMDSRHVDNTQTEESGEVPVISAETASKHSKCDSCSFENIEAEAVAFCIDCSEQ